MIAYMKEKMMTTSGPYIWDRPYTELERALLDELCRLDCWDENWPLVPALLDAVVPRYARRLAERVAPKYPDIPLNLILVSAATVLREHNEFLWDNPGVNPDMPVEALTLQ